ncbi:peptidoglycan-binding protein [Streptomyces tropicalis]|uniref:Peptidoglycan-binding protein n=1 Tax=Streptomyces tropicalis TaxID=3034234 RepID=A0ABT5ZZ67_9ACTN|nr:peptidoglycan-binding protein [Streptomyces tropicalis]MDF3297691.1 peptidoglycan-binding protein [Streptomyces tropicalis]
MGPPVFEDTDPGSDCDCPGCVHGRGARPHLPARPAAPRAFVVAAVTAAALGAAGQAAAADAPSPPPRDPAGDDAATPQGQVGPLFGSDGTDGRTESGDALPTTNRAQIIERALRWVDAKVPYRTSAYWSDGYRQDCSGFVSMAWRLPGNEWTGSLGRYGVRITKAQLQPGDMLLFHNAANPQKGSHVVLFGGWTDRTRTAYVAYEQTPPHARRKVTPYAYWVNSSHYVPYRYKGLVARTAGAPVTEAAYPGARSFGPGADNASVTRLGRMLVGRGARTSYAEGPGPRWSDADRRATAAFQRAQGWTGVDADGLPGPATWRLLVTGTGRDVPAAPGGSGPPASHGVSGYPGGAPFRPGADSPYVTRLGRRLVEKGYGRFYTTGPGPHWSEADRRAVAAFQRAQGWRGGAADGHPGPETWRRLFA